MYPFWVNCDIVWTLETSFVSCRKSATQEGLTASPWSELAHLSSALDGFEAAIQQAEVSTARNGPEASEASDEMDGGTGDLMNHLQECG